MLPHLYRGLRSYFLTCLKLVCRHLIKKTTAVQKRSNELLSSLPPPSLKSLNILCFPILPVWNELKLSCGVLVWYSLFVFWVRLMFFRLMKSNTINCAFILYLYLASKALMEILFFWVKLWLLTYCWYCHDDFILRRQN